MSHEFFTVNEINSFESGGTQESTNQYKEVERGGGTAESGAAQGSGAAGATGGFAGAISGVISAVVSVTVLVAVITTFILSPPTVSAADWQILHNSISFLFEGEGSDNGYVITLYEGDTAVEKISLESHKQTIEFSNLQAEKTIPSLWKMITEWV